jgi:hypothetical protein
MPQKPTIQAIAAALGGQVYGSEALAPAPAHGPQDLSRSVGINALGNDTVGNSFAVAIMFHTAISTTKENVAKEAAADWRGQFNCPLA